MRTARKVLLCLLVLCAVICLPASAINYGNGTYGSCQYGSCSITISSGSSLSLDVTPSGSSSCTIQKDDVSVLTGNSSGYTLSLIGAGPDTALVNGGDEITTTSAAQSSPATLGANHWGYRVDGLGSFGNGPTSAQDNSAPDALTFAGIPGSNDAADTIASTTAKAEPAETTSVWYGVCANTSVPNGTYTTQVVYTAVTN